jgi:DNA-binding MarR family transcriptional regulator
MPDLAILIAAAYRALIERLLGDMDAGGIAGMRPAYGFVIRAVAAEEPTVNRLAELLDISKQAASKLAQQMVRGGFIVRVADRGDRRSSRLRLAKKGERVRAQALATSAALERELRRAAGPGAVDGLRRALLALLARQGGLDDVLARRARPVW